MSVASGEVEPYFGHEFLHSRAPVVSRDLVVQVLPDSIDAIVVRAIRWQEVQPYLAGRRRLQGQLDLVTGVYAVVAVSEMDLPSALVCLRDELVKKLQEEEAVLPIAFDPSQLAAPGIQSTGEVTILVASGSEDGLSLPGQHPVWSSLGIQVNVNLIDIQNDIARSEVVDEPSNRSQSTRPTRSWPGALHDRFGPSQPNPQPSQEPTHRGNADANAGSLSENENQQILCPYGTPVAVLLR
jgi:hypothetical protein